MSQLEDDIKKIANSLPGQKKDEFLKCVEKLKHPNSRPWLASDDSLSGVQRVDQDCRSCIEKSGKLQEKIESCIERLLADYSR